MSSTVTPQFILVFNYLSIEQTKRKSHPAARKNVTKCTSVASFGTNLMQVRSCQTFIASFSALIALGMFSESGK